MKSIIKKAWFVVLTICVVACSGMVSKLDAKAASGSYTIIVDRQSNIVNVVDDNSNKVVRAMYCSTGKDNGTITGTFHTEEKYRWHALFGDVYGQYCTRIHGSYLFHSIPYFSENHGAMETEEFNKLGTQASMGCVRLAVADAKWIYDHCDSGTKVVIGDNKNLIKPEFDPIKISTKKKAGWDPTDPDEKNPYRPTLKLIPKENKIIKKGDSFDPMRGIKVSSKTCDKATLLSRVSISGTVDTDTVGSYKVKYSVKDPVTGLKKSLVITYEVVD